MHGADRGTQREQPWIEPPAGDDEAMASRQCFRYPAQQRHGCGVGALSLVDGDQDGRGLTFQNVGQAGGQNVAVQGGRDVREPGAVGAVPDRARRPRSPSTASIVATPSSVLSSVIRTDLPKPPPASTKATAAEPTRAARRVRGTCRGGRARMPLRH